jgi:hypothetical protein
MGDAVFFRYLVELAREPAPLVRLSSPSFEDGFVHGTVGLTGHGERVLERQEDAVRLRGIDRWLGGAYLRGREPAWRWDPAARALRPSVGG